MKRIGLSVLLTVSCVGCSTTVVPAPATDERVHPESDFQAQVQRLIQQRPLGGDTTEAPRVPQRSHSHGQPGGISASGVNDMRPAARSRSERLVEMVGDGRRLRCRRHDPVVYRPHTRECRRRVHRAAVPLRLKLNINQRRGYAAQSYRVRRSSPLETRPPSSYT